MNFEIAKLTKNNIITFFVAITLMFFTGCAPGGKAVKQTGKDTGTSLATKLVTNISVAEDADAVSVFIMGNSLLTYTSVKQPYPFGVILYLPATALGNIKTTYTPGGDIIDFVKTSELTQTGHTTRIEIALKKDVPYKVIREGLGIKLSFARSLAAPQAIPGASCKKEIKKDVNTEKTEKPEKIKSEEIGSKDTGSKEIGNEKPCDKSEPDQKKETVATATRLESVGVTKLDKSTIINIEANGSIKDFKSFGIENPARIIFDLFNITSPYKKEQVLPVNTDRIKQVRYFSYPDRVRLVLDVNKKYIASFSACPLENGLSITVGEDQVGEDRVGENRNSSGIESKTKLSGQNNTPALAKSDKPATKIQKKVSEAEDKNPAWINRIDFSSEDAGKSTIIIGTTKPVKYNIKKTGDTILGLELFNTNIPLYYKRPLITTRFESAVDRISPGQISSKNISVIAIELREQVPYIVEQTGDLLMIHFEPSSIPPKPFAKANLPPWKEILLQVAADVKTTDTEAKQQPDISETYAKTALASKEKKQTDQAGTIAKEEIKVKEKPAIEPDPKQTDADGKSIITTQIRDDEYDLSRQQTIDALTGEKIALDFYRAETVRKYTGEKIALDFYETDIKNVIRIIKEVSGKNFAIDNGVTGNVTLAFDKPAPWDQVLDIILKMNQLGKIYEGDIIRIGTLKNLKQEETARKNKLKAKQEAELQEDLVTAFIAVNYADAEEIVKLIKIEGRGSIVVDTRNNMIILTAAPIEIKRSKEIIQRIDKVTPQVIIEARIVEVSDDFAKEIGIDWTGGGGITNPPIEGTEGVPGHGPQRGFNTLGGTYAYGAAMNFPVAAASSIGFSFTRLLGTPFLLDATLNAMQTNQKAKIISAPKILTLDNKKARIKQGLEYPYLERDDTGGSSVKFKNIDLLLEVTPHVTPDNRISISIFITKNDVKSISSDGVPSLTTNEAETELLVNNGDTIVIGGIIKQNISETITAFPGLSKIPFLGWFFRSKMNQDTKNELLVFITPTIVRLKELR